MLKDDNVIPGFLNQSFPSGTRPMQLSMVVVAIIAGKELQPALFAWFAEVEFLDGEIVLFKGDVAIVR
jgi:hypothetical protein